MLLDDDVMAERQPKTGPLTSWLGREERVEHFVSDLSWNPYAIVADTDFHLVAEVFRCCRKRGLVAIAARLLLALVSGIEAIRDHIEKNSRDFLRKDVDLAGIGGQRSLQR